ncbi:DUF756 domain-containing protein [Serratia ureilytica]
MVARPQRLSPRAARRPEPATAGGCVCADGRSLLLQLNNPGTEAIAVALERCPYTQQGPRPITLPAGGSHQQAFDAHASGGWYDLGLQGADGWLRHRRAGDGEHSVSDPLMSQGSNDRHQGVQKAKGYRLSLRSRSQPITQAIFMPAVLIAKAGRWLPPCVFAVGRRRSAALIVVTDVAGRQVTLPQPAKRARYSRPMPALLALEYSAPAAAAENIIARDNSLKVKAPDLVEAYAKKFPQVMQIPLFDNPTPVISAWKARWCANGPDHFRHRSAEQIERQRRTDPAEKSASRC